MRRTTAGRSKRLLTPLALAAVLAIGMSACGTAGGGATRTPTPAPSATTPSGDATFQVLAVSGPKGSQTGIGLYDSVAGTWQTIATGGSANQARFAADGRVAYLTADGIVSEKPDGSDRRIEVAGAVLDHGWRSDGAVAYVTAIDSASYRYRLTIKQPGKPDVDENIGFGAGRGGFFPQSRLAFSPDGTLLLDVEASGTPDETFQGMPNLHVRGLDGTVRFSTQTEGGATWGSQGKLYFFADGSLQVTDLTNTPPTTLVTGIHAWNPATSPDGRYLAYEQRDPQSDAFGGYGPPRLGVFDTTTGKVLDTVRLAGAALTRFVQPTQVWFSDTEQTGPIQRYDLATQAQGQTGISGYVTDVRYGAS